MYAMERAYDLGRAMSAIRMAAIYLEQPAMPARALQILRDALTVLDENENKRVEAIFGK